MTSAAALAGTASLAADPARAAMVQALLAGKSLTAAELARAAGVTAQTASGHLKRLTEAGLVVMTAHGRHRYHRLAGPRAAQVIETLMAAASLGANSRPVRTGPRDAALRAARICYDHLAGALGVALADALRASGSVELDDDAAMLTADGQTLLERIGIDTSALAPASGRIPCRPCLDWSERRPHLAGRLGAVLCNHCFEQGWVRRSEGRALSVTPEGRRQFRSRFGLTWPPTP
jgi:DNA-binding transcriptional ArsR family regulator